jgi:hypothetical protein
VFAVETWPMPQLGVPVKVGVVAISSPQEKIAGN